MKTSTETFNSAMLVIALLASVLCAWGQGTGYFSFNNGIMRAPIYGPEPNDPSLQKWGNTPSAIYPGTQTYTGAPLAGTNYSVEAWYSLSPVHDRFALATGATPILGSRTSFPSVSFPGFFPGGTLYLEGVWTNAPGMTYGVFLQVRTWDNAGGQIASWDEAWNGAVAGNGRAVGWSQVFWQELGFASLPEYSMNNFESYNIFIVPEPGTVSLIALGGVALLWRICRRRQWFE